jgi:hypothetical protein
VHYLSSPCTLSLLSCIPCLGSALRYILCAYSVHSFPVCITSTSILASLRCTCFVIAWQILSTPCRHSGQTPHRPRRTLRPTDRNTNTRKVIHLASDEDSDGEDEVKTSTKGKAAKSTFVVKGYQAANPLEMKTRKVRASTSQAADTISAVGHYFSPEHMCEREEAWANTSLNMFQLQSAQTELREA